MRNRAAKEEFMTSIAKLMRIAALAATIFAGGSTIAIAQTADEPADTTEQDQGSQLTQPGTTGPGMMGKGMMGQGMMQTGSTDAMPMMHMRGHMMKIMFAVADTNADGGLSFEELATIQRRIFDQVDANKDGKVTAEEIQAFMRE
jgi:hypothetical protein